MAAVVPADLGGSFDGIAPLQGLAGPLQPQRLQHHRKGAPELFAEDPVQVRLYR